MPLDLAEIRKLKTELRRDMEALERMEALVTMRQSSNGTPKQVTLPLSDGSGKPSLRGTVMAVLERATKPLRPTEIVELVAERGYPFASPRKGMGSVTKVLFRQLGKSVEKKDGKYALKK